MIRDIQPIPNADRIETATVDGWHVVISKSDNFSVGDSVVYIEIDSKMPPKPEYEFLKSRKYIVKTIKIRGQVSQGLILPLSILPPDRTYKLGDDVTDILGITKYDPELEQENKVTSKKKQSKNPIIKYLCRFKWFRKFYVKPNQATGFPDWISKTDEERIQNCARLFEKMKEEGTVLSATEKVDGTSATFFLRKYKRNKYEFGVCSRNRWLRTEDDSYYWKVARKYNIEKVLKKLIGNNDWIVLQGEITGQGIQGNKYPASGGERLWAFNLKYPGRKCSTEEMTPILAPYGIFTVPIVTSEYHVPETIDDIVEFVKGQSQISPREREGCVFRNVAQDISFKCINPNFLLKEE